jgi:DNA-binding GntR family transcriptional regulator
MVAEILRGRILGNELQPGQQLPAEHELCGEFQTSRITIRRALQILEEELLVRRRQGSGTFVTAKPARKVPVLSAEFDASLKRHAPEVTRRVDLWEWRPADEETAAQLHTFVGDRGLFVRRIDSMGSSPVAMDEVWILRAYADRLTQEDLAGLDSLERWQKVQRIEFAHSVQAVEAVAAEEPVSGVLHEKPGAPVLKETEIAYLTTGAAAAMFVSYYRHDCFRLIGTVRYVGGRNPELQTHRHRRKSPPADCQHPVRH